MADKWKRMSRTWRKLYRAQTYLLGVEQEYSADGRKTLHKALLRARKWRKGYRFWYREAGKWIRAHDALSESEAASLKLVEEYRAQGNEAIRVLTDQREGLLAWRRGVREAMPGEDQVYKARPTTIGGERHNCVAVTMDDWDKLRRAIESEARKGET